MIDFVLAAALFSSTGAKTHVDIVGLIRRSQQGDSEAVAMLYQVFSPQIYRYIVYRVPTSTDAEDLTAEVFMRMVEGLPGYQITDVPFEVWLYRIASARIADFYRESGKYRETELDDALADERQALEDVIQQRQSFETVRDALQQLSDEQQMILVLRFVERKSHEEVAAILGKSVTAVKSAQHRALQQLAALLGSEQKTRHYLRGQS